MDDFAQRLAASNRSLDPDVASAVSANFWELYEPIVAAPRLEPHNPHISCDLQGGHVWSEPVRGEDMNGNALTLVICTNCGKVRA